MRRITNWLTSGLLAAAILIFPVSLLAQATIPVSGTKVVDNQRQPLTGKLVFTVTDASDTPITYTPQGGSPTAATFTIPVVKGAVQNIGGFPPTIAYPATFATPANAVYRIQVQSVDGSITYFTYPLTQMSTPFFSYDGYIAPVGILISGAGIPSLNCNPGATYNNTLTSDPYPWVCSKLQGDASVYWTQNPSRNPSCSRGNDQAIASSINGTTFCIDANQAYVTPGFVWAGPSAGGMPSQIGLVPVASLCAAGNCGGGSAPVVPPSFSPQLANNTLNGFVTDSTLLVNTTTHNLTERMLNNIPYASQYQTGAGGNGIANLFTSPNMIAIKDNGDSTDTAVIPPTNGSTIVDLTTAGTFGNRFNNCNNIRSFNFLTNPNTPFLMSQSEFCDVDVVYNTVNNRATGQEPGTGLHGHLSDCEYPGYSIGNQPALQGRDQGWTGCGASLFGQISYAQGIQNNINVATYCHHGGDCNILEFFLEYDGGCTAASDQCETSIGFNGGQGSGTDVQNPVTTSVTSATQTGGTPTVGPFTHGNHFTPGSPSGGFFLNTQTPLVAGSLVANAGDFLPGGVVKFTGLDAGHGQNPSAIYSLTSVGASAGGVAVYTGTITGGASDALVGQLMKVQDISDSANGIFTVVHSSSTTLTLANPNALAGTPSGPNPQAAHYWHVSCTGGGGTGAGGSIFINPSGVVVTDVDGVSYGSGYTAAPACSIDPPACTAGGSACATFTAHMNQTIHVLQVAGGALTPVTGECMSTTYVTKGVPDMTNQTFPVSCTVQHGHKMVPGFFQFASDATPEGCTIVTASDGAANQQNLTVNCHLPHQIGSSMLQGGTNGYIWFDADAAGDASSDPWPFSTYVYGAIDSTHLIYGWLQGGGQANLAIPKIGGQRESFTSPNNTYKIYCGAQVVSTTSGGTIPTLNTNNCTWNTGDAISQVLNPASALGVLLADLRQNTPLSVGGSAQMALFYRGNAVTFGTSILDIRNLNNFGMYAACDSTSTRDACLPITGTGGWAFAPTAVNIVGPFDTIFSVGKGTGTVMLVSSGSDPTPYNLITTAGGTLVVQPSTNTIATTANFFVAGNETVGDTLHVNNFITMNQNSAVTTGFLRLIGDNFSTHQLLVSNNNSGFTSFGYGASPNPNDSNADLSAGSFNAGIFNAGAGASGGGGLFITGGAATAYAYCATSVTGAGEGMCLAPQSTGTGPTTLSAGNNIFVKYFGAVGAQSMNIYRHSNGSGLGNGRICSNVTLTNPFGCYDTGQAAGAAEPTSDTSGLLTVHGVTHLLGTADLNGSALCTVALCPPSGITLTTTGTSGAATLISGVLNIPNYAGGGGGGFPITLGSTSIASGSTTTTITGLTLDGVTPTTFGFVDFTSSGQTQLNAKAPLASPTLTGTPLAPTAAANTNTTQIATTAYYVGQAASAAPLIDGTATIGTSLRFARQDHVHPTDTTRAGLASPTFSGVVTAPTFVGALTGSATQVGGITVTGTPAIGNVLTATSTSAANWQAPSGGSPSVGAHFAVQMAGTTAGTFADSGCTADGAANQSCLSQTFTGTTQGYDVYGVGTGTISATLPTNYVGIIGPASGTPAYFLALPNVAPTAGQTMVFAAPTTVNGLQQAVGTWTTPGAGGFPITIGSTSIAASSTTTTIAGLTIDGVTPTTMGFLDATSSIQTQLNAKGVGSVTTVSVTTANGVSGSVATATSTPAITLTLGAITPTSTNGVSAATMAFNDATSSIQTQLNGKAPTASPTFTGTVTIPNGGVFGTPTSMLATNVTGLVPANIVAGTLAAKIIAPGGDLFNGGIDAQTGTTYTMVAADENKLLTFANAATVAVTLPVATTAGFIVGAVFDVFNKGAGTVTITPTTSTINGVATLVLTTGQGARIVSDGTNYSAWGPAGAGGGGVSGTLLQSSATAAAIVPANIVSSVASTPGVYTDQWDVSETTQGASCTSASSLSLYFMWQNPAVATTTLSAAITTTGQTAISVTSGTDIQNGQYILVGTEYMQVTAGGGTTSLTVTRAAFGTTAATALISAVTTIPVVELAGTMSIGNSNNYNGYKGTVANHLESILAKNATAIQYATTYTAGTACSPAPAYQVSHVYTATH